MRTFGVEEELLIVDPVSGEPRALADALLLGRKLAADDAPYKLRIPDPHGPHHTTSRDPTSRDPTSSDPTNDDPTSSDPTSSDPTNDDDDDVSGLTAELKLEQIETQTRPCLDYSELLQQIRQGRALADRAARKHGARVAALATSPIASTTHTTPNPRYFTMQERFGLTAHEQLTCGFHVHTFIESQEEGVAVLDRIRDKLAVLVALSANSPFWNGVETGFESYRTQAWNRWPTSGPSQIFGTHSTYRRLVTRLLDSGVLLDEGMIYFDARLSRNHPTVEVRVADVCLEAEDAALIAVLVRGLVESASREWRDGVEPAPVPTVLLRMAAWQASNSGLRGELLDFGTFRPAPARDVVEALVDYVAPVLAEQGELELARKGVRRILDRGTGSEQQRRAMQAGSYEPDAAAGRLAAVVVHSMEVTMRCADVDADTAVAPAPVLLRVRQS